MNFLAHAYLSFNDPEILVGNMIADLVKGKQIESYPERIQQGIHIHRKIDAFTDAHPVIQKSVELFRTSAGRYAGPFLDVSLDHFLALDLQNEPDEGWLTFAEKCYSQIETCGDLLPSKFCSMFLYMKKEDWLYNYRYSWMIDLSFSRLKRRANYLSEDAPVFADFEQQYLKIKDSYDTFFPDLKAYVQNMIL